MPTQIGTDMALGAGTITGSYIVTSRKVNDPELDTERVFNEGGTLVTLITYNSLATITLELLCISGAAPETDFIAGQISAHTDFSNLYVESAPVTKTKSPHTVSVVVKNLGFT